MVLSKIVYRFVVKRDVKIICESVENVVYSRLRTWRMQEHVEGVYFKIYLMINFQCGFLFERCRYEARMKKLIAADPRASVIFNSL